MKEIKKMENKISIIIDTFIGKVYDEKFIT